MGAAALAVLVHAGLVLWWVSVNASEGAKAAGTDGMQVSVGLAGSYMESVQRDAAETVEPVQEDLQPPETDQVPDPQPPEPVPEPESAEAEATPEPAPDPVPEPVSDAALPVVEPPPAPAPPRAVAKPRTKPKAEPKAKTEPRPKAKPQPEPQSTPNPTPRPAPETETEPSQSATRATGTGQRVETGGNPAARQSYLAEVLARIARYKRYPREARHDGVMGVVTVTFTILANGSLQTQQVTGSSGDARLDQAALEMLSRASPFPPIPRDMGVGTLELTLPVEFSLNQKRTLF